MDDFESCEPELAEEVLAQDCSETDLGKADNGEATLEYPEVVLVKKPGGRCTGTLVGERTILTAAHCLVDVLPGELTLSRQETDGQWVSLPPAREIVVHGDYSSKATWLEGDDICIVRLEAAATGVQPTALATQRVKMFESISILGYGLYSRRDDPSEPIKRLAQNYVATIGRKSFHYYSIANLGGASCFGDSGGGSFVVRDRVRLLAGVHESGSCTQPWPAYSTSTRVDKHVSWILENADDPTIQAVGEP